MILANVYQNFSQNAKSGLVRSIELFFLLIACSKFVAKSIHQIAWFQFSKIQNFPASKGGTPPLRHPLCTQATIWYCDTPPHPESSQEMSKKKKEKKI